MNLSHDERRTIHEWLVPLLSFADETNSSRQVPVSDYRIRLLMETWLDSETVEDLIFEAETIAGVYD